MLHVKMRRAYINRKQLENDHIGCLSWLLAAQGLQAASKGNLQFGTCTLAPGTV